MSNVQSMLDQMSGILTPVHIEPLFMENGDKIRGRKVVVDTQTSYPISVVSSRYAVVSNEEAYTAVAEAIDASMLDINGLQITALEDAGQRRSLVSFVFPEHQISLDGDMTNLRLVAKNSYDGSWKIETLAGAFRMACANGQVFGDYLKVFSSRHSANMSMSSIDHRVNLALETFETEGDKWKRMSKSSVSKQKALNFLCRFFNEAEMTLKQLAEKTEKRPSNRIQYSMDVFEKYSSEMGPNLWALYNTMTEISTFNKSQKQNVISMQQHRESQVRKVITSPLWSESLAA